MTKTAEKRAPKVKPREVTLRARDARRVANAIWNNATITMAVADAAERVAVFLYSLDGRDDMPKEKSAPFTAGGAGRKRAKKRGGGKL